MKVLKIKENKDGSGTIDYEVTKTDQKIIKTLLGVKRLTIKRINKFVKDGLIACMNKEAKKLGIK